jgi:uncharacterized protein (TIGR04222 family)
MDWLLHNAIAVTDGPHFLLLYGGIIAAAFIISKSALRMCDASASRPPLAVPRDSDPYEVAYLRGGRDEVTRLILFNLLHRGYLRLAERVEAVRLLQAPDHPDPGALSEIERMTFDWFADPSQDPVSQMKSLPTAIQSHCSPYFRTLRREQLLTTPAVQQTARRIYHVAVALVLGLGGYHSVVALMKEQTHVLFPVAVTIAALLLLRITCKPTRLTVRGQRYLWQLRQALGGHSARWQKVRADAGDPRLPLLVSLFGMGILSGTPYRSFGEVFHPTSAEHTRYGDDSSVWLELDLGDWSIGDFWDV